LVASFESLLHAANTSTITIHPRMARA
jgi:hypothetical protein